MNIIESINQAKRLGLTQVTLRRKNGASMTIEVPCQFYYEESEAESYIESIPEEDFLASDWSIKNEEVLISKHSFDMFDIIANQSFPRNQDDFDLDRHSENEVLEKAIEYLNKHSRLSQSIEITHIARFIAIVNSEHVELHFESDIAEVEYTPTLKFKIRSKHFESVNAIIKSLRPALFNVEIEELKNDN